MGFWGDATESVIGVIPGAGSLYSSVRAAYKANKIKPQRPTYEIPKGIMGNLDVAQAQANSMRLPGQNIMEDNLRSIQSDSISQAQQSGSSSGNILDAITKITANSQAGLNNINLEAAKQNFDAQQNLIAQNQNLADYQDKGFQFNKVEPYLSDVARKQALEAKRIADSQTAKKEAMQIAELLIQAKK